MTTLMPRTRIRRFCWVIRAVQLSDSWDDSRFPEAVEHDHEASLADENSHAHRSAQGPARGGRREDRTGLQIRVPVSRSVLLRPQGARRPRRPWFRRSRCTRPTVQLMKCSNTRGAMEECFSLISARSLMACDMLCIRPREQSWAVSSSHTAAWASSSSRTGTLTIAFTAGLRRHRSRHGMAPRGGGWSSDIRAVKSSGTPAWNPHGASLSRLLCSVAHEAQPLAPSLPAGMTPNWAILPASVGLESLVTCVLRRMGS